MSTAAEVGQIDQIYTINNFMRAARIIDPINLSSTKLVVKYDLCISGYISISKWMYHDQL